MGRLSIGSQANAWNAVTTGSNGTSSSVFLNWTGRISAFGHASGATTITLQYSQDNSNFYDGPTQVLSGAGDFRIDASMGCQYARLKSSADVTATGTIAGKE